MIVVDAPCSGSGLFRREPDAVEEWSPNNVALCSQRQQRILANVWTSLKKDGVLIYSTCSYSNEEDEEIADWLKKELIINNEELIINPGWGIVYSNGGYRFWPDKVKGEGLFLACFRKTNGEENGAFKIKNKKEVLNKKEIAVIDKWVAKDDLKFIKHDNTVFAWPGKLADDLDLLLNKLHLIYSGTVIGELVRDKLLPDHAFAMSDLPVNSINRTELDHRQSIQYLQRKEPDISAGNKGWQLVTYQGHSLGWINALPNRINNYYPKELRILKDT